MEQSVNSIHERSDHRCPVVAIGASAGGLDPVRRFLSALPPDFGFSLVFIQHLSSKYKSILNDLLQSRRPDLSIAEISDGEEALSGRLYLSPPGQDVTINNGVFHLSPSPPGQVNLPIDAFFFSLAKDAGERATAVILSGTGTDGARGIRSIRMMGGTVFVQDPATAEYSAMPLAAINTGQVDAVLPPEEIAREILKALAVGEIPAESEDHVTPLQLKTFFQVISDKTGYRFEHYKKNVISRRIRRRMYLHGIASLEDYLKMLSENASESLLLAYDIMIGVTSFFRDKAAWDTLKTDIIRKIGQENEDVPIRVWTPACATGEEAYSITMMLCHEFAVACRRKEVQVFATDVNARALEKAREGKYPSSVAADIPPEYMQRFFTLSEDGLTASISKEIRERVVFARQDILTDPPFSRLDLIICRNLLIYLEPVAQEKCLAIFHYALKEGGFLFLGNAESTNRNSPLFKSLGHKKARIYQKIEMKPSMRRPLPPPFAAERTVMPPTQRTDSEHAQSLIQLFQAALLEDHAPAAVGINQNYDILYYNGPTNRYLRPPRGAPTQNLLDLLPENLRRRFRGAIYRATKEERPVAMRSSITGKDNQKRQVTIRISKLKENLFLIAFQETGGLPEQPADIQVESAAVEETAVRQMENELQATQDALQSNIEQLKSLNEELQSSNEELHAANEELETSREELQSLNEELITVNAQLQGKIEEQEATNNDLNNFLASTNIPTLFLDRQFKLRRFTPAISKLLKLLPSDVGRPIIDMSQESLGPDLIADAQAVLDHLVPVRKEIAIGNAWQIRMTLPYRTSDDHIEGVVIAYTDVTGEKQREEDLRRQAELINLAYDSIFVRDMEDRITFWNRGAEEMYGWTAEEALGKKPCTLLQTRFPKPLAEIKEELLQRGRWEGELDQVRRDGSRIVTATRWALRRDSSGNPLEILETNDDITAEKRDEEVRGRLAAIVQSAGDAIISKDLQGIIGTWNVGAEKIYGFTAGEAIGRNFTFLLPPGQIDDFPDLLKRIVGGEHIEQHETQRRRKDGTIIPVSLTVSPIRDDSGSIVGVSTIAHDISERKRAEERRRHLASFPQLNPHPIIEVAYPGQVTFVNPATKKILTSLGMDEGDVGVFLPADFDEMLSTLKRKEQATFTREIAVKDLVFSVTIHLILWFDVARLYFQDITERKRAEEQAQQHVEELRASNEELMRLNRAMEGRELRMIELKKEINELRSQAGQPPPYPLDFEEEG